MANLITQVHLSERNPTITITSFKFIVEEDKIFMRDIAARSARK